MESEGKHGWVVALITIVGVLLAVLVARWMLSFLLNHWMLASSAVVIVVFAFFYFVVVRSQKPN